MRGFWQWVDKSIVNIVINGGETEPRGQTPNQSPQLPTSSLVLYTLSSCSSVGRASQNEHPGRCTVEKYLKHYAIS